MARIRVTIPLYLLNATDNVLTLLGIPLSQASSFRLLSIFQLRKNTRENLISTLTDSEYRGAARIPSIWPHSPAFYLTNQSLQVAPSVVQMAQRR